MPEIIPSILPKDYEDLKNRVALVKGFVPAVQVDICDGVFVPSKTWPFLSRRSSTSSSLQKSDFGGDLDVHFQKILNEEEGMPFWDDIDFELDLLVADAVENFDIYLKLGMKRVIFHLEAFPRRAELREFLEGMDNYLRENLEIGIALNPSTPLEELYLLVPLADFVQFMGSDRIGFHGVEFDERVCEKIEVFRGRYNDLPIAVDIGVNETTAPKLLSAGATKLVIGSALWRASDIIGKIEEFRNL